MFFLNIHHWLRWQAVFLLLCLGLAGCSTVRVSKGRKTYEGAEIKGTRTYELRVQDLVREPVGVNERVVMAPEEILRRYKREEWRATWDNVTRKRFLALAGVHEEYKGEQDFAELILAPLIPLAGMASTPVHREQGVAFLAGGVAVLPFVTLANKLETVERNRKEIELKPLDKVEDAKQTELNGFRFEWDVEDASGDVLGKGKVRWPEPIELPWVKWVLKRPLDETWRFAVKSDELTVSGVTRKAFQVDLKDAIHREWPNPKNRPMPSLKVTGLRVTDWNGKKVETVIAGYPHQLEISIKNGFLSSTAYLVRPVLTLDNEKKVEIETDSRAKVIGAREEVKIRVPLTFHLDTEDSVREVSGWLEDGFGRRLADISTSVRVRATEAPDLELGDTAFHPEQGRTPGKLLLTLPNRGKGDARGIWIEIYLPRANDNTFITANVKVDHIAADTAKDVEVLLPEQFLQERKSIPVRFKITEALGLPPILTERDVRVLDSEEENP